MVHGEAWAQPVPLLTETLLHFPEGHQPSVRIESWSNSARTVQVRGFTLHQIISHDHTTAADRSKTTTEFDIVEFPLMMQAKVKSGGTRRGECYVRVSLLMSGFEVVCLFEGYVTDDFSLCWPVGHNSGPTEGPGYKHKITIADPAIGDDLAYTVPTNTRMRILSLHIELTTDSNAANRLLVLGGGGTYSSTFVTRTTINHAASLTKDYLFTSGWPFAESGFDAGGYLRVALPANWILVGGDSLGVNIINHQVGDAISPAYLEVEEWIEE